LNTADKEFFVSYKAGTDEDKMRSLYRIQNKWIERIRVINIGGARNIDKKINIGLSQPVSLREFIRNQPADPNKFHHAMDVDNGSKDGKPVIIIMPNYLKAPEDTYNDLKALAKAHRTTTGTTNSNINLIPSDKSNYDKYADKMTAFLHMANLSSSDSDDQDSQTTATPTSRTHIEAPTDGRQ
jgi:hypothetical protein